MTAQARRRWLAAGLLLAGAVLVTWWTRPRPVHYPFAYVADRAATLWSTTAQVRQPMATLAYGEKVSVIRHAGDQTEVRTDDGTRGWVDAALLMDPALWGQKSDLLLRARSMPVQAVGHTRTLSNVHLGPGRDSQRIFQFGRNVPLLVLDRKTAAAPSGDAGANVTESGSGTPKMPTKMEDWLLVLRAQGESGTVQDGSAVLPAAKMAETGPEVPIAGWVLARFVDLDPPSPIPEYASAAAMRVIAWSVLNRVSTDDGEKPQYLVAGTRGGEGQPCDFTMLRVFTWDAKRDRYETAYIENNVCGRLPLRVSPAPDGAEFRFADASIPGGEGVYRLDQTIVRPLVALGDAARPDRRAARGRRIQRRSRAALRTEHAQE